MNLKKSKKILKNTPKILALDISTRTIGSALFDIQQKKLLELTHFTPILKPEPDSKGTLQIVTNARVTQTVKLVRLEKFLSLQVSVEAALENIPAD